MYAPELGAAVKHREHLAGVEQALRIEGAFEPLLLVEVRLRKHRRHEITLLDAHAVLAGEHAADLHAKPEDICAEALGAVELVGIVGVEQNKRMKIAVAGMEDIRHS